MWHIALLPEVELTESRTPNAEGRDIQTSWASQLGRPIELARPPGPGPRKMGANLPDKPRLYGFGERRGAGGNAPTTPQLRRRSPCMAPRVSPLPRRHSPIQGPRPLHLRTNPISRDPQLGDRTIGVLWMGPQTQRRENSGSLRVDALGNSPTGR